MKWISHRLRKLIVGSVIGVYGVAGFFFPVVGRALKLKPVERLLRWLLTETGEDFIFAYIEWTKDS